MPVTRPAPWCDCSHYKCWDGCASCWEDALQNLYHGCIPSPSVAAPARLTVTHLPRWRARPYTNQPCTARPFQSSSVKCGASASRFPPTPLKHGGSCFCQRHPLWRPAAWGAHAPRLAGHARERVLRWRRQTRPEQARRGNPTTRSADRARNSCQLMRGSLDAPQEVSSFENVPCGALFRDLVVAQTQGEA
jgi:hypothetical protein